MSAKERPISLPDTAQEDALDSNLTLYIPLDELDFPELPPEATEEATSDDDDSDSEESEPCHAGQFLGKSPQWIPGSAEDITAYAAARHGPHSWALFGRGNGSFDLYCSPSRFQDAKEPAVSPPMSPEALSYPKSNLLSTRLTGRKPRRDTSSPSSLRSYSKSSLYAQHKQGQGRHHTSASPPGSVRSVSSHSDLPSAGLGRRARKASATLSISGLEALTSAPVPTSPKSGQHATAMLQHPALIEPTPAPPEAHIVLSEVSSADRGALHETWQEEAVGARSPEVPTLAFPDSTPTSSSFLDLPAAAAAKDSAAGSEEALVYFAHVDPPPPIKGAVFDGAAHIKLLLRNEGFTHAALVLSPNGRLCRISLKDGRLKDLGMVNEGTDLPVALELLTYDTGCLVAVILRSGIVKLLDVRSGKLLHQLESGISDALVSQKTFSDEPSLCSLVLLGSPENKVTVLNITLSPPADVGSSVLSAFQVASSIESLGEAPIVRDAVSFCVVDEYFVLLCPGSLHVLAQAERRLVDVAAASVPSSATSVVGTASSGVFAVSQPTSIQLFRLLSDGQGGLDVLSIWETATPDVKHPPRQFSPFHISWLSCEKDKASPLLHVCDISSEVKPEPSELGKVDLKRPRPPATAALVLDHETIAVGYRDGRLVLITPASLGDAKSRHIRIAPFSLHSPVARIWSLQIDEQACLLAVSTTGQVALWSLATLEVMNSWSLFTAAMSKVAVINTEPETLLLLLAQDGALALVPVHSSGSVKLMVPPIREGLQAVMISESQLVLRYYEGLCRMYDIPSGELRRTLDAEAVEQVVHEPGWSIPQYVESSSKSLCLAFNIRSLVEPLSSLDSWDSGPHSGHVDSIKSSLDKLAIPRLLLSHVLTSGVSKTTHALTKEPFIYQASRHQWPKTFVMPESSSSLARQSTVDPPAAWKVSRHATTYRLACITTLIRLFLNYTETQKAADELIVYYSTFLGDRLGDAFQSPSLDLLADLWFDTSAFVSDSVQLLFGSVVSILSCDRQVEEAERWHALLPISNEYDLNPVETKALLIAGLVAVEAHKSIEPVTLRDISNLVFNILHAPESKARRDLQRIAVELCARGFAWVQQYSDAVALVQCLFALATGKEEDTPATLRSAASKAILQVASANVQLFMATMAFDVLHTTSANHRNATMRLIAFMVRRKPVVMQHSLPKLCEAVVRTLDPKDSIQRTNMQQTTTVIIGELVRTYPSIAFDRQAQKLACGTSEGAVLVYDLKSATRLFVLESHTASVDAVSFSPDGRRLVSMSLQESTVAVWKVGSSVLGFFQPGRPPRQNAEGNGPYKRINFTLGDPSGASAMSLAAVLEWVKFDWQGDRTVSLRIRDASFTFAVA